MSTSGVQIDGIVATLSAVAEGIAELTEQVKLEIQAAGFECEAEAKKLCPVDTGRLRSSITHEEGDMEFTVFTNVNYAIYQEFGTRNMAAQPFMTPGFEIARQHFLEELGKL